MTKHLWQADHSYYMTEGNYFANNMHERYDTWAEFHAEFGDSDMDYNYVVRWDWLDGEDHECPYTGDDYYRNGKLLIQFVGQRKAKLHSCEVSVCRADEAAVREWLLPRFQYAVTMWEPFEPSLLAPVAVEEGRG